MSKIEFIDSEIIPKLIEKFPEIEFQKIIFREETSITIPKEGLHTVISF